MNYILIMTILKNRKRDLINLKERSGKRQPVDATGCTLNFNAKKSRI